MTQSNPDIAPEKALGKPDAAARRTRMREFQTQLFARMQAARSGTQTQVKQLGVMIGQSHCLLNLQEAGEIISVGSIMQVPLTKDWFLGLSNIRGNLFSVVDFARFQGMPQTQIDKDSRIIAFASSLSFNGGLLVSRVLGLRNTTEMQAHSVTEEVAPWSAKRYMDTDSNVWTEINLSLVVQDPQFLHVGL